jgi:hypothetical protein
VEGGGPEGLNAENKWCVRMRRLKVCTTNFGVEEENSVGLGGRSVRPRAALIPT